jgi:hypothetical protein
MALLTRIHNLFPVWLLLAILLSPNLLLGAQSATPDGDWWQKSSAAEQEGFILGYGECYASADSTRVREISDEADIRIAVSTYYQSHASERHRPTAKVLQDVWSGHINVRGSKPAREGEGWRERHGFLDGGWWKGSNPSEQLGFVEGYVTCHNAEQKHQPPLRHLPSMYVSQVSYWYDQPGDDDAVAQRRATKIQEVLTRIEMPAVAGKR